MNVILHAPILSDAEELYAVVAANREHLTNLVWAAEATYETTAAHLYLALGSGEHFNLIKLDGKTVGVVTIRNQPDGSHLLGYWLAYDARGKGVMTLAVKQALREFGVLKPVFARVRATNKASLRVLQHCGFRVGWNDLDTGWIDLFYRKGDTVI